jgi:hypothetical protein
MVAIINTVANIRTTVNYNERKIKQQAAMLIHSKNFAKDTAELLFTDKLKTFEKLSSLNERTKFKSVHISLNFDPSEKLDNETLQQIADSYMKGIGFTDQPYLVYEHYDSGHPHIHIVSINIQRDGTSIKMHNIGRNQSARTRKKIEKEFRLVAADKHQKQLPEIKPVHAQKVHYGKSATKGAITNVLNAVIPNYKYSSLPELNAILGQYNVLADRGKEGSRTYQNNGLVYRVLNENGQTTGMPIKASDIDFKPTLKLLQQKFKENEEAKQKHKLRLKNAIDYAFASWNELSLKTMTTALQNENIQIVFGKNKEDFIYDITYIDHHSKTVFNGNDLGNQYSAGQFLQRCKQTEPVHISQQEVKPDVFTQLSNKNSTECLEQKTTPTDTISDEQTKTERQGQMLF